MLKVIVYTNIAYGKDYIYSVEPASRYLDCGISEAKLASIVETYNRDNPISGWRASIEVLEEDDPRYQMVRASLFHAQKIEQQAGELLELGKAAIVNLQQSVDAIERMLNRRNEIQK